MWYLIRELDFNDAHVDLFISKFRKTIDFAGILKENAPDSSRVGDEVEDGEGRLGKLTEDHGDGWAQIDYGEMGGPAPMTELMVKRKGHEVPSPTIVTSGFSIERATLDEGPAVLQWPESLSKDSFDEFEYWIKGVLRRARRKAGLAASPADADAD